MKLTTMICLPLAALALTGCGGDESETGPTTSAPTTTLPTKAPPIDSYAPEAVRTEAWRRCRPADLRALRPQITREMVYLRGKPATYWSVTCSSDKRLRITRTWQQLRRDGYPPAHGQALPVEGKSGAQQRRALP